MDERRAETVEDRLAAVERALTDGDHDLTALADAGDLAERVDTLEGRVAEYDERITELEAATQALRGYVGNVRAVNEDVRQRADRALRVAEREDEGAQSETASQPDSDTRKSTTYDGSVDEPTLELGDSHGHGRQQSQEEDSCPLCDGDGPRDRRSGSAGREIPTPGSARLSADRRTTSDTDTREGLTDGGIVEENGDSTTGDDSDLLHRIRTLL